MKHRCASFLVAVPGSATLPYLYNPLLIEVWSVTITEGEFVAFKRSTVEDLSRPMVNLKYFATEDHSFLHERRQ
jgi:hypothetical protein